MKEIFETKICETCKHEAKEPDEFPCDICYKASKWKSKKEGCYFCNEGVEVETGDCDLSVGLQNILSDGKMISEYCLKIYINNHGNNGSKNHYELLAIKNCPICGREL